MATQTHRQTKEQSNRPESVVAKIGIWSAIGAVGLAGFFGARGMIDRNSTPGHELPKIGQAHKEVNIVAGMTAWEIAAEAYPGEDPRLNLPLINKQVPSGQLQPGQVIELPKDAAIGTLYTPSSSGNDVAGG